MGSIKLILDIKRVDLLIAICVVVIATILFLGFIIWLVKSARQNKALKSIDAKLDKNGLLSSDLGSYTQESTCKKENAEKTPSNETDDTHYEYSVKQEKNNCNADITNDINDAILSDDEPEVDVMAEIRKMLKETEGQHSMSRNIQVNNMGKSGRVYSKEDIENIIKD